MPADLPRYLELTKEYPRLFSTLPTAPFQIEIDPLTIQAWHEEQHQKQNFQADIGVLSEDPFFTVVRDLVCFANNQRFGFLRLLDRGVLIKGFGVAVLPVFKKEILLFSHYRQPIRDWSLEIPRGFGEAGLTSPVNALKELREETSIQAVEELIELGSLHANNGIDTSCTHLFLARVKRQKTKIVELEMRRPQWVSLLQFEKMLRKGQIQDGFTMAAYTRAKLRGLLD